MPALITVLDAAGMPLSGAEVTVDGTPGTADANGRVALPAPAAGTFVVTAAHPDHLRASFTVSATGNGHQWNVPGHEVTGGPGQAVVTVRLGRLDNAPTTRVGPGSMAMT